MSETELVRIETNWLERGFTFGIWEDPPKQAWEDFIHDQDELFMVLEGNIEIEIEGKVSRPQFGEEIFIPAGSLHSVRNLGSRPSKWLYGYAA